MKITNFIARKYLFSKQHISLISTLTLISIVGVTIGTALLIIVLSVFNGFFDLVKNMLLSYDPDIRIVSTTNKSFVLTDSLINDLSNIPEIRVISPYAQGKCILANTSERDKVVIVRGVQPDRFFPLNEHKNSITEGKFNLSVQNRLPGILIGDELINQLHLTTGDKVSLMSAQGMQKALTQFAGPSNYRFEIRGAFRLRQIFEGSVVFVDLRAAQRLFHLRSGITGIDIKLDSHEDANAVKARLQNILGKHYTIKTWYDLQKPLYDVMYLEKWGAYLILMIIVLVAVLNIVGSLTMIVLQKNRDIGIMLTMGFSPSDIKRIFLKQGLFIGLIGCGFGGITGLLLSWLQKTYGLVKLAGAQSFIVSAYPVNIQASDVIIVTLGSLLLCVLASWYPATRASKVAPADAIRYE
jgi:lipoprotein-releasing system permease protein